jgi:hypothetical protein
VSQRSRPHRPLVAGWVAPGEVRIVASYVGLCCFLLIDVLLRNIENDLPLAVVIGIWGLAFAVPCTALVRLRPQYPARIVALERR